MQYKDCYRHLKRVLKHKYWVFRYSLLAGIPLRGLFHDLSKFSLDEFLDSTYYYKTGIKSPIKEEREELGYSLIWLHHKGRNKHHFEYWVDNNSNGELVVLRMPFVYALEMLCDWLGAGRTYMGEAFSIRQQQERIDKDAGSLLIHPQTKLFIQLMYKELGKATNNKEIKEVFKKAEDIYSEAVKQTQGTYTLSPTTIKVVYVQSM
jgi:hypothetical protein